MKAIDLYSGIGGWTLGFRAAGIDVIQSYEWWDRAANTEQQNLGVPVTVCDIRSLQLSELPTDIDIVVGSPPCTQFSYSNRGGAGDISDGIKDIAKFLEIVEFLKPRFWAMENVPRVKKVLEQELSETGQLAKFAHLKSKMQIEILDASEYGLPQRRKRCIAGNYPAELLASYKDACSKKTLKQAVSGFNSSQIRDVNFGFSISSNELVDHDPEPTFDKEEVRLNRDSKTHHPVYNDMQFPDPWDKPVRTITATCSRVSRESIVINDFSGSDQFRRLTVRERACVQGFPLTYQLFGKSHAEKTKMVGNAVPPVLTYYIANAMLGVSTKKLRPLHQAGYHHPLPQSLPDQTKTDHVGKRYPKSRRFRAAIPNLRFKSGTRFDLRNKFENNDVSWVVEFFFGPSKEIRTIPLDEILFARISSLDLDSSFPKEFNDTLEKFQDALHLFESHSLQQRWTNKNSKHHHPFELLDLLGDTAQALISKSPNTMSETLAEFVISVARNESPNTKGFPEQKLRKHSIEIFCGLLLGSYLNSTNEASIAARIRETNLHQD